jgi:hypothetical protein
VRKVDVAVAALVVAATATATVVLPGLDDDEPQVSEAPSGEVVEIHPNIGPDRGPVGPEGIVTMDPDEPLVCMMDLDCLLHEVEVAAGITPAVPPPGVISEAAPSPEPAA